MDFVEQRMKELAELRLRRLPLTQDILSDKSPDNPVNCMIADMINYLENMYIMMNVPVDGFVSLTPKKEE